MRDEIEILRREVEAYAVPAIDEDSYYLENLTEQVYSVVIVPRSHKRHSGVIVLAKIVGDKIVIDVDITNHYLRH